MRSVFTRNVAETPAAEVASVRRGLRPAQSAERQRKLQELLTRLGQDTVASVVLLVDQNGQPVAHWYRMVEIDVAGIASLTAASIVARQSLSLQLCSGGQSVVVHEYDDQIVLVARADLQLVLMVVLEDPARLGWARVAVKRAGREVAALSGEW